MRNDLSFWRWEYALEQKRQHHASSRNLWRQAAFCVVLAVLPFVGRR